MNEKNVSSDSNYKITKKDAIEEFKRLRKIFNDRFKTDIEREILYLIDIIDHLGCDYAKKVVRINSWEREEEWWSEFGNEDFISWEYYLITVIDTLKEMTMLNSDLINVAQKINNPSSREGYDKKTFYHRFGWK